MTVAKPNFIGRFTGWSILDSKEYEKKKDKGIKKVLKGKEKPLACPECDSTYVQFNKTAQEMNCRKCGCSGRRRAFISKLREAAAK